MMWNSGCHSPALRFSATAASGTTWPSITTSCEPVPRMPNFAAWIEGVDLARPLSAAVKEELRRALNDFEVIFFRPQQITPARHVALARVFGPLSGGSYFERRKDAPDIEIIESDRERPPTISMWLRKTPSKVAPIPASAARERTFSASVLNSTRRQPSVSKACVSPRSFASLFAPVPCAAGASQVGFSQAMGFLAVVLASVNIFGGFVVTQRMLGKFKKKQK